MLLFQSIVLISAIAVFLVVMVALVAILLFAKKKLTPQSKVKITINDKDTLEVDTGNSLMLTLKEHNIHLPSACGGGGSCGMCKCRVVQFNTGIFGSSCPLVIIGFKIGSIYKIPFYSVKSACLFYFFKVRAFVNIRSIRKNSFAGSFF